MLAVVAFALLAALAHGQACNGPAAESTVGSCSYNSNVVPCYTGAPCDQCVALNFNLCSVPMNTASWRPGLNVLDNCWSLAAYTAVATFDNGVYNWQDNKGHSAIFTRCIDSNRFEVIDQWCEQTTTKSVYPRGGYSGDAAFVFRTSAENYFVITG